jgi:hypothetical protein
VYLRDEHGRNMHYSQLYARLGLNPNKHLPAEGVPPTDVDGVIVYVLAVDHPRRERRRNYRGRSWTNMKGKRTYAICPDCQRHIEAGHLHQHVRACKKRL